MELSGQAPRALAGAGLRVAVVVGLLGGALAHLAMVAPVALAAGPTPVDVQGPALALTPFVPLVGDLPSATVDSGGAPLGAVRTMEGNYAPSSSAAAQGQVLSSSTYPNASAVLGSAFGGDGSTTFGVPDLQGRTVDGTGSGAGLSTVALGDKIGANTATITRDELPVSYGGAGALFTRREPALGLTYLIRTAGRDPLDGRLGFDAIGVVIPYAGTVVPAGWMVADGRLLAVSDYIGLYSLIGTTYGGDGVTTFALPDLRGRAAVEAGCGSGLSCQVLGETSGEESATITTSRLPVGVGGGGVPFDNNSPSLALTYVCKINGVFPPLPGGVGLIDPVNPFIGEVMLYAGGSGELEDPACNGQLQPISQNQELFSIIGTTYGGDGRVTFGLPNLQGRAAVGAGCGAGLDCVTLGELFGLTSTLLSTENLPAPLVPGAPTGPTAVAVAGTGQATLSWSAPVSNGGSPVTGYVVTPYIGTTAQTPVGFPGDPATTETITGLTNGTPYTFTVAATNAAGTGPASTASNVVTPTVTPLVLARIDGAGNAWVKVGSLANPWTKVATGVSAVAVASDATNGVLIGIINTNGFYAKFGVTGTWTHELAAGATAISVATDTTNGALLGVLDASGFYAKKGLNGAWNHEIAAGATAISVATDPVNGAVLGVVNAAGVYVKKGLTGLWNHEIAAGATAVSVATDATNGALIGVVNPNGLYVKQGLTGTWLHEIAAGATAVSVATDATNGALIGVLHTTGFYAKIGLTGVWNHETPAGPTAISLATDATNGPLIGVEQATGFNVKASLAGSWTNVAPAGQTAIAVTG